MRVFKRPQPATSALQDGTVAVVALAGPAFTGSLDNGEMKGDNRHGTVLLLFFGPQNFYREELSHSFHQ